MTSWQFGIRNIVCSSGTAFTPYQIALLSRYAEEVVLVFDADVAGREASEKIFSKKRAGVKFRPLVLSQGVTKEDLDSFLKKKGPEAFRALSNIKKESIGLQEYVAQLG